MIIVITDGGKYSFRNGVHNEIVLPLHAQIPGTKLTKEPFRWDQRLFSLVLRMAGHRVDERIDVKVPHDDSPIEKMCEVTGGRSYKVRSHYVLNHCIESLVQKVQAGVVVQFEQQLLPTTPKLELKVDGEQQQQHGSDLLFPITKKMIYVQKNMSNKNYPIGYWPLPEPYWPDPKAVLLPPRDAHPRIRILSACVDEPVPVRNFPVDKYELEPSPLTMQILARREMNRCWPVVVVNSGPGVMGPGGVAVTQHELPFGYLKANNTFTQVYLVVLPINYPVLLPLLHDLLHRYMGNPPNEWMYKFTHYVRSIPQYYCPFLRRALASISVPYQLLTYIIPENLDSYLSQPVANHLKSLKNAAKQDLEALCMRIFKQLKHPKPPHRQVETAKLLPILQQQQQQQGQQAVGGGGGVAGGNTQQPIGGPRKEMVSHPMLRDTFAKVHSECQFQDNYTIVVPVSTIRGQLTGSAPVTHAAGGAVGQMNGGGGAGGPPVRASRNPFDIRRRDLVDEIARMRENFFKMVGPSGGLTLGAGATTGVNGAAGHCLPISEMGNYQEYLKNKETPLREIEPTNVRQHMFGNPYKKDKHMVMVDEADMVGEVAPMMKTGGGAIPGGSGGGPGGPMMMNKKMGEVIGGMLPKMSRKRKAGPIARDYKFRRLSTSSVDSYGSGSSRSGSEYGDSSVASSSEDFDDEEQPLVMDFEKPPAVTGVGLMGDAEDSDASEGGGGGVTVKSEGRLNGAGVGGIGIKEEREEALLHPSDRLLGLQHHQHSSMPVVLTPSEGVLSPVYQQPTLPLVISPPSFADGGVTTAATTSQQSLPPASSQPPSLALSFIGAAAQAASDVRKHLPNGTGSGGAPTLPSLERSTSSTSKYNDADEISKILQQSCSQHNGTGAGGDNERKKSSRANTVDDEESNSATAASSASSTSGGGRKRRQMTKQASSELLEVADAGEEKDSEASGAGTSRRQSPRMAGSGQVGQAGKGNNATAADRLSSSKDGTGAEEKESSGNHQQNHHTKGGWPSRRRGANHSSGKEKHPSAVVRVEEQDGDPDVQKVAVEEEEPIDVWLGNGESVEAIKEANFAARTVLFHDIRRPGRDYGQLLEHLELVRGDFETQFAFIQMCIAEAMRFHRKKMATTIQEWWDQKIDRITRSGNSGGCGGEAALAPAPLATVVEVVKVVPTAANTKSSSRQKTNVKLRSGTGAAVPASKC